MPYYAVARGFKVGVFNTWQEYNSHVRGFKGSLCKKFNNLKHAEEYIALFGEVARGFKVGVFKKSKKYTRHLTGFKGARGKKFDNREDAEKFIALFGEGNNASSSTSVLLPNPKVIANSATSEECYAVARGHTVGIFLTWHECESQLNGFEGAYFKKCDSLGEAKAFIEANREHASSSASVTNSFLSGTSRGTFKRTHKASVKIRAGSTGHVNMCGSSKQFTAIPGADTNPHGPIVYTDGGCARNGMSNVKAGYGVFWGDGHKNNVAVSLEGGTSNNGAKYRAVIAALIKAIEDDHSHITIKTDSKLLIKSMTKWPSFKKKNKLKKKDGSPVSYFKLIFLLAKLMRMIDVKFEHVEARAGIHGQEMAHKLARQGAKRYKFDAIAGVDTNPHGLIVYTDGACASNGKSNAKAGYGVFWGDDHQNNVGAPLKGRATNNRAEYTAVIVALKQAIEDGHSHITIRTDSEILIKAMTQRIDLWKKNKFKKTDGTKVLNVDLIKELDNLMKMIDVKFEHGPTTGGLFWPPVAGRPLLWPTSITCSTVERWNTEINAAVD
ncbi:RNase H domain-containing protein [Ditylenchus destructor]|nr:RNase H domain-containing protein [Ditylenchus destructor]